MLKRAQLSSFALYCAVAASAASTPGCSGGTIVGGGSNNVASPAGAATANGNLNNMGTGLAPDPTNTGPGVYGGGNVRANLPPSSPNTTAPSAAPAATDSNGFFLGIHVNWDADTGGVGGFIDRTGVTPVLVAGYVTATPDGSFELSKAKGYVDDAVKHGVKTISFAVTAQIDRLSDAQLSQMATAVTYGVAKGLKVGVRYGYEMNGNWSPAYHGGDTSVFLRQWAQAEKVVHASGGYMIWAPNLANNGGYENWMPDPTTIDEVGLDAYHQRGDIAAGEVDGYISSIYPLAQAYQKPFVLTETGVVVTDNSGAYLVNDAETAEKKAWLDQLVATSLRQKYPLYRGFVWFDYQKKETASGLSGGAMEARNFAISVDALAATMFRSWYPANFAAAVGAVTGVSSRLNTETRQGLKTTAPPRPALPAAPAHQRPAALQKKAKD